MLVTVHEFVSGGALQGYAFVAKSSYEHQRDSAVVFKVPGLAEAGGRISVSDPFSPVATENVRIIKWIILSLLLDLAVRALQILTFDNSEILNSAEFSGF